VILFDNKSTHSFIDKCVVKEVKAVVKKTTILVVIVANESVMKCNAYCLKLLWFIEGQCILVLGWSKVTETRTMQYDIRNGLVNEVFACHVWFY